MNDDKEPVTTESVLDRNDVPEVTPGREEEKKGTDFDQHDMVRMGKRQETRVRYSAGDRHRA